MYQKVKDIFFTVVVWIIGPVVAVGGAALFLYVLLQSRGY